MSARGRIANWALDSKAAAAIEFAILGGALCLMMVVATDLALGFYYDMQVQTSAQSGAEYAAVHGFDATAVSNAVTAATSSSDITASPAPTTFCGCPSAQGVSTISCSSTCSDGSNPGSYVTVSAAKTYTTLIPYPSLPASYSLAATSTVRLQ